MRPFSLTQLQRPLASKWARQQSHWELAVKHSQWAPEHGGAGGGGAGDDSERARPAVTAASWSAKAVDAKANSARKKSMASHESLSHRVAKIESSAVLGPLVEP